MTRPLWYDRDGNVITVAEADKLLASPGYKRVALTRISSNDNKDIDIKVSTVWLGLDHGFGDGPPAIFETMAFGDPVDQYQYRWNTIAEARQKRAECVTEIARNIPGAIIDENWQWPKELQ